MSVTPNISSLSFAAGAMQLDEKSLAQRFAEGDAAAFEAVVAIHRPRITRLVYRLLAWPADVDDLVQEVFLAALTQCRKFRGESALATWLTVIALNKCRDKARVRVFLDFEGLRPSVFDSVPETVQQTDTRVACP